MNILIRILSKICVNQVIFSITISFTRRTFSRDITINQLKKYLNP
jgi:hypothetical protein